MRYFDAQWDCLGVTTRPVVLPCSSAPLQSLTATASHQWPYPRDTLPENESQPSTLSGPSILRWMSTTRMGTFRPETISHEGGPIPEPDGGHRGLLPWGSAPFGGISSDDGLQRCLGCTIRSQGFSPSQRFSLIRAWWLCFTPHPPLGFLVFRAFPSPPAAISLDIRCSPVVTPAPGCFQQAGFTHSPSPPVTRLAFFRWRTRPRSRHAPRCGAEHQPYRPSSVSWVAGISERSVSHRGLTHDIHPVRASPWSGKLQRPRVSQGVDFRALFRRRVRSRHTGVTPWPGRCSPDLSPSEVYQLVRWAFALPSSAFKTGTRLFRGHYLPCGGPGYRSKQAWK